MDQSKPSSLEAIVEAHPFFENPLDEFENYTYNLEWFVVSRAADRQFQIDEAGKLVDIVNNRWPKIGDGKITIAKTGVTTEFNLTDLNIESVGAGNATMSKIAGTAINLNFNITQVGNTGLIDNLQNALALSGYHSINTTTFYIKINFVGLDHDYKNHKIPQTKVIPFNISQYTQLQTQSDARGTTTVINGVILPDRAVMDFAVSRTEDNFEYKVGGTLAETLKNFSSKLNQVNKEAHPTLEDSLQNTYFITMSKQFITFLSESSSMMNREKSMSRLNENMKIKSKGKGETIGQVMAGMNIYSIIEEICQNDELVIAELTTSWAKYSKVLKITPYLIPKENGYNPVTGKNAYDVEFYIDYEKKLVIQNMLDQADKATKSKELIEELFKDQHVNKIYHYLFTGKNDQILDFNITLDNELVKIYTVPGDFYAYEHFLKTGPESKLISKAARQEINKTEAALKKLVASEAFLKQKQKDLQEEVLKEQEELLPELIEKYRQTLTLNNPNEKMMFERMFKDKNFLEAMNQIASHGGQSAYYEINSAYIMKRDEDLGHAVDKTNEEYTNKSASVTAQQGVLNTQYSDAIASTSVVSGEFNYNSKAKQNAQKLLNSVSVKNKRNLILAEELDDDVISRLSNEDFEILLKNQQNNPIVFQRMINRLASFPKNTTLKHVDPLQVRIAREKYYESKSNSISMINATMTIKGDPYWLEGHMSPAMLKKEFGDIGTTKRGMNAQTTLNGSNGLVIVSGIASGTDLLDNVLTRNLITSLYVVTVVNSSFSSGIFTQTLTMRKNTQAEHMATVYTSIEPEVIDGETDDSNNSTGSGPLVFIPETNNGVITQGPQLVNPRTGEYITNPHMKGSLLDQYGTGLIYKGEVFTPEELDKQLYIDEVISNYKNRDNKDR